MATQRFNYNDKFKLNGKKVGISSASPQENLDVASGTLKGVDLQSNSGITTFSTYEGFLNKKTTYTGNVHIDSGESGTLSGEIVVGSGLTMTVGIAATSLDLTTSGQGDVECLKVFNVFNPPCGGTANRPSAATPGTLYYNKDFKTIEYWDGNFWRQVDNITSSSGRAVFMGGDASQDVIDYFNMSTLGNAISFGEIAGGTSRIRGDACSSQTRGLMMAGFSPAMETDIDYITLASEGNSIKFGDLTDGGGYMPACLSSSTRGIKAGGVVSPAYKDTIQYVEINTLGDGVDFGTLTTTNCRFAGLSNATKGLFGGGYNQGSTGRAFSLIDEITIASKGNAISFRNLDRAVDALCAASNSVRGVWAGGTNKTPGGNTVNSLSYITIASGSDAVDFGDLARATNQAGATGSQRRVLVAGGGNPTVPETVFVEYSSLGNAMDFGELTAARRFVGGCSDSHGGLGGF